LGKLAFQLLTTRVGEEVQIAAEAAFGLLETRG